MSIKLKVHKTDEPETVFEVVEVSPIELKVLKALGDETLCGEEIARRSNNGIRISGVYAVLGHLLKKKLVVPAKVESSFHTNGLVKKFYKKTYNQEELYHGKLRPDQ